MGIEIGVMQKLTLDYSKVSLILTEVKTVAKKI